MERVVVSTKQAPTAIGPYSQAIKIKSGDLVFCSGSIPLDPVTGQVVGDNAAEQAKQVLDNLTAVLKAAGSGLNQVVKTTVFLHSLEDFNAVNDVYGTYFPVNPPARSTVEVARLPKDVLVEIEAVAIEGAA